MKRYILSIYGCVLLLSAVAQQRDSVVINRDSIVKVLDKVVENDSVIRKRLAADTAYRVKFNALDYSMQQRYQPKGEE